MSNMPARSEANTVAALINRQIPAIAMAVSGANAEERKRNAERFARVALTTIRNNPSLTKADPTSLVGALMTAASLNLEIDPRGLAYIVPYKGKIQFQIGYKGLKELAYRSAKVKAIYAETVFRPEIEQGMFEIEIGLNRNLRHKIDPLKPDLRQGALVLAYAVAEFHDGTRHFDYVTRDQVEKRKKASQGADSSYSPWTNWEEEMWKKTAIKKLCNSLPMSVEVQRAVSLDDQADAGVDQSFDVPDEYIDVEPMADEPKSGVDKAKDALSNPN